MAKNRDDFSKKTVDVMAKRVGYLCSKPDCRRSTVGPHSNAEKTVVTGVAAHITAAAKGGARYNENLTSAQRKHISNGIWLCSYHAGLVDKDEDTFPVALLEEWKRDAEEERQKELFGGQVSARTAGSPYLEAELIWTSNGRAPRGYDRKANQEKFPDGVIGPGDHPVILWNLMWDFSIVIYNNSQYPAYNISLKEVGEKRFTSIGALSKVNSLKPYANIDLDASYERHIVGTYTEADEQLVDKIPSAIVGLTIELVYYDEARREYTTKITIAGPPDYIINERL